MGKTDRFESGLETASKAERTANKEIVEAALELGNQQITTRGNIARMVDESFPKGLDVVTAARALVGSAIQIDTPEGKVLEGVILKVTVYDSDVIETDKVKNSPLRKHFKDKPDGMVFVVGVQGGNVIAVSFDKDSACVRIDDVQFYSGLNIEGFEDGRADTPTKVAKAAGIDKNTRDAYYGVDMREETSPIRVGYEIEGLENLVLTEKTDKDDEKIVREIKIS